MLYALVVQFIGLTHFQQNTPPLGARGWPRLNRRFRGEYRWREAPFSISKETLPLDRLSHLLCTRKIGGVAIFWGDALPVQRIHIHRPAQVLAKGLGERGRSSGQCRQTAMQRRTLVGLQQDLGTAAASQPRQHRRCRP